MIGTYAEHDDEIGVKAMEAIMEGDGVFPEKLGVKLRTAQMRASSGPTKALETPRAQKASP